MKKALLLLAAVVFSAAAYAQDGSMMKSDKPAEDGAMMKADPAMKPEPMMDKSAFDVKGLGPQVVAFTSEKDAQMLAKTQTVVYYFAATWCPTCRATHQDVQANFVKLPRDLTLVYVNYDKSADLKKKYGVTSQHTFVVIGQGGEKRKVWNGSMTVADIVKNAKAM